MVISTNCIIRYFVLCVHFKCTFTPFFQNKVKDDINELLVEPSESTFFIGINYTLSVIDNIDETDK